jgi:multiple sugar transport system ATP-binding protein
LTAAGKGTVTVGLRPEALTLAGDGNGIPAVVNLVEELGSEAYVYSQLAENVSESLTANTDIVSRVDPNTAPKSGDTIQLHVKEGSALLFDAESGARITGS